MRKWPLLLAASALAAVGLGQVPLSGAAAATPKPVIGLTVPWAIGGPRFERDGTLADFPGEWPTIAFTSLRLWDTRTAWLNIEPADDAWDFSRLDQFVAKAELHGVRDILLVLGGTPRWAAAQVRPADAPWLGPGSASPPRAIEQWAQFVTKVAERYRGRITGYEIGNEPNSLTYWSGTPAQWAEQVRVAAQAIHRADPAATVIASGFSVRQGSNVQKIEAWLRAMAGVRIDGISIHWYPRAGSDLGLTTAMIGSIRRAAVAADLPSAIWITEMNVRGGGSRSAEYQSRAVQGLASAAKAGGVEHCYWYAWTNLGPADLMVLQPGTPAAISLGG